MADLSVLIAARNEQWLKRTIDDVLKHARADTEVICVLDGTWADPPIPDHLKVTLIHRPVSIGQRAAVNLAAKMSRAKFVMKLDAHCAVAEGFDVALMDADREIGRPDVTQIPSMRNLHVFNWKCKACGTETYQGPLMKACETCTNNGLTGGPFEQVVYWDLNAGGVNGKERRTDFWRFDHDLHFQYGGPRLASQRHAELADVMSSVGACFFMRRERFIELGGLDEDHGSWGQFGTEIACKSWLSGGLHIVNRRTYFAHLFRTNAGFSFPYGMRGADQDYARRYSQNLWLHNNWPGQVRPLSWLIDHFWPIKDWSDTIGKERLALVRAEGEKFRQSGRHQRQRLSGTGIEPVNGLSPQVLVPPDVNSPGSNNGLSAAPQRVPFPATRDDAPMSKGIVYYSDCRGDARILQAVRDQLQRAAGDIPIVSVTLAPLPGFGRNIHHAANRGYETMFRQILLGLEASDTDVVFFCEHDVLYHESHFRFTPPTKDVFYFNQNTWRVDAETGRALFYYCNQVSGLCADRQLLLEHYRKRVAYVEKHGFDRNIGFEPGCNSRVREKIDAHGSESWMSAHPNVDIKTKHCLTPGRWSQDQFRNKNSCLGWQESEVVPTWGRSYGRFWDFLAGIGHISATEGAA